MKFLVLFGLVFFSFQSFASQCCYCEIGREPANERHWYKKGCQLWLNSQKGCTSKAIVDQNTQYASMNLSCDKMMIGYVGHWKDSFETANYLYNIIQPLMSEKPVSVFVDNTACSSMTHPDWIRDEVRRTKMASGQKLIYRGNQVISIGKWDEILGKNYNFWAQVQSDKSDILYPNCSQFEGYNCFIPDQLNEVAKCVSGRQLRSLKCCAVTNYNGEVPQQKFAWNDPKNCGL